MIGCRADAPTEDELKQNLAIMEMKKVNADKLGEKFDDGVDTTQVTTGAPNFPRYDDYERVVGKRSSDKK